MRMKLVKFIAQLPLSNMDVETTKQVLSNLLTSDWSEMTDEEKNQYNQVLEWVQNNLVRWQTYFRNQKNVTFDTEVNFSDVVEMTHWDKLFELLHSIRRYS